MLTTVRDADVLELSACGETPGEAVARASLLGSEVLAGRADGEVVCLFGVTRPDLLSDIGIPWMIGTERLAFRSRSFLAGSRAVVERWQRDHAALANLVDARNLRAIRWLRWLGFCIHAPVPFGPLGLPFHPFTWTRS